MTSITKRVGAAGAAAVVAGAVMVAAVTPASAVQRKSNGWPGGYAFRTDNGYIQGYESGNDDGQVALAAPAAVIGAIPSPFYYGGNGLPDAYYLPPRAYYSGY